ncbi:MAG: hypothetical protein J6B53_08055 [Clostridia bacterium]|nr:hypothetical protein [Clostridia bacterium]
MNSLNSGTGYKLFKKTALFEIYVDKTMMIDTLYRYVNSAGKYLSPDPDASANPRQPT